MLNDERRNHGPKPEILTGKLEDFSELRASDLEINRVYALHSPQHLVLLNYMGIVHALHSPQHVVSLSYMGIVYTIHPKTLDVVRAHSFYGLSANVSVFLVARPRGAMEDLLGNHIAIRECARLDA